MANNRIKKGIVVPGFIKAERGHHGGIKFLYLPLTSPENGDLSEQVYRLNKFENVTNGPAARHVSEEIAKRIKWWSEENDDGSPAPINGEEFASLHPTLWRDVTAIVRGYTASDMPDASDTLEMAEYVKLQEQAKAMNKSPGEATVGKILGN